MSDRSIVETDRIASLCKLGLLDGPGSLEKLGLYVPDPAEVAQEEDLVWVKDRYLLHLTSQYEGQDDAGLETRDTLDEAEIVLIGHVTQEAGSGYSFWANVYDLDLGEKVGFDVVTSVAWCPLRSDTKVMDSGLSIRARKAIYVALRDKEPPHITMIDVASLTAKKLLSQRNFGAVALKEVEKKLAQVGLKLRE